LFGYVVTAGSVVLAAVFRQSSSDLPTGVRFAPYYIAVALTASVGGGGPGSAALGLSAVVANYMMPPAGAATTRRQ
jgi:hypothetical protein